MADIHIEHLSFAYSGSSKPVLNNINCTIPRGEFLLVAGPSGCGKSTLALALAGLIPSRIHGTMQGEVYFGKTSISTLDIHETAQHIGMVFQNPDNQLVHLDVESEVSFGPENLGLPREVISQRVKKSLSYTRMETQSHSPIYELSGGQKQRVAISATLAMEPDALVLDEPTSDLDPLGTQEVLQVLQNLNREKKMTIILIEHKIDEVIPWVDRVLLMNEGSIVLDDSPRRVFQDEGQWSKLGVSVPEMVRLSHRLSDVFSGRTALNVEEAYDAISGSAYHERLLRKVNGSQIRNRSTANNHNLHTLIDWQEVGLSFPGRQVLRDINLSINARDWVALSGPNGSGKTSLASMAMGLQAPTSGHVRFKDCMVNSGQISKQAAKIGYLFQAADNMLFTSKVRDEIMFGKKHRKKNESFFQDMAVEKLANIIDLDGHLEKNPFSLSFGQRKRLAIGALLAAKPEMMILDEPTTGQDAGHADSFLAFLQFLRQQFQMTYLMITHDMRAIAKYASRMVILNDGKIVLDGPPSQVFAHAGELSEASILPPPIAKLHGMLCHQHSDSVVLDLGTFLELVSPEEASV